MAKRNSKSDRRLWIFIGGVPAGFIRENFLINIEAKIMSLWKSNSINKVWANICKHEGDVFHTVRNIGYTYVVEDNYILINNDPRRRITKANLAKVLELQNPTCSKISNAGIWGPSYIYGVITDSRIK